MKHILNALIALILLTACMPAPTATPLPTVTALPTSTPTTIPLPTPTALPPTATATARPTSTSSPVHPTPTTTPKPEEMPSYGTPIFTENFSSSSLIIHKDEGNPSFWSNFRAEGTRVDFLPAEKVMKITLTGPPVTHTDWDGGQNVWYTGYPGWSLRNGQTIGTPSAVQVDLFRLEGLPGSFLSVHRSNVKTGDRNSVAGIEINQSNTPVLITRDGRGHSRRVSLDKSLLSPTGWNTLRMEFKSDGTVIPFINGVYAYVEGTVPSQVPVDDQYPAGFVDAHAGYLMAYPKTGDSGDTYYGQSIENANFIVEGPPN